MAETIYIATDDIYAAPGVLAFATGSVVPASAVENLDAKDKVAGTRTKAASEAIKVVSGD